MAAKVTFTPKLQDISITMHATNSISEEINKSPQFRQVFAWVLYCLKVTNKCWLINDEILRKKVYEMPDNKIDQTILEFYSQNNYLKIQEMFTKWKKYDFLKVRFPILKSCLNVLLTNISNEDKYNTIIPTLTAQLSGLKESLYKSIPEKIRIALEEEVSKDSKNKDKEVRKNIVLFKFLNDEHVLFVFSLLELRHIIFNIAFAGGERISKFDIQRYNKFRNKILHGDSKFLNYGTEVNMIRAWLEVDFLIMVHNEIHKRSNDSNTNKA